MRISEQWLREWVDPPVTNAELAAQLTMAGLEVDSIEPAAPNFTGVVVGRVIALTPHPDAERLRVAQVDIGQPEPLQIVCGAPNVQVGMHAPTALVGALLPGEQRIKPTELRGVASQGMLCSAQELGLADSVDGLLVLAADSVPGADLRQYLALDDPITEIDLTPNRGDCLSMAGVAREVGVLNRCPVTSPAITPVPPSLDATFAVTLSAPVACPRYAGRVIRGVDPTAKTPWWLRERLRRAGLRALSPLVDVTNYVMLELGQPLHAFDLARLTGGIEVRHARPGETLTLLDGSSVELDADTLLICDANGPLALAGIMGGAASAVDDTTRDIFLESAFFAPTAIAGRARRYGLRTDASHRFERGVDPQLQVQALERATSLLLDIAGGSAGPLTEIVEPAHLPVAPTIRLRAERITRLLGLAFEPTEVSDILQRLGMTLTPESECWQVIPPPFRFDIALEADLIEEIGRIYGYNRLPGKRPSLPLIFDSQPEAQISLTRVRETLIQRGFHEAITYSFVDPAFQELLDPEREPIALANPISADLSVMRTSLWPGLIKALIYNQKRQQSRIRLFECGQNFIPAGQTVQQDAYIGGVVCGEALAEQWGEPRRAVDFFDLKADVEALLSLGDQGFAFEAALYPALHPGQSARIVGPAGPIGWIGALHPQVEHTLELENHVYVFELRTADIRQARLPTFRELSKFPVSRRDIAIVVPESVTAQAVFGCIRAHSTDVLRDVRLFDVYRGKGIAKGYKSMALGLILQDFSRNLTDALVDQIVSDIVAGLTQQLGATLRV